MNPSDQTTSMALDTSKGAVDGHATVASVADRTMVFTDRMFFPGAAPTIQTPVSPTKTFRDVLKASFVDVRVGAHGIKDAARDARDEDDARPISKSAKGDVLVEDGWLMV